MNKKKIVLVMIMLIMQVYLIIPVRASYGDFTDVPIVHWAYGDISLLAAQGIINGYEDNSFRPDEPVLRAEWAKLLCEISNLEKTYPPEGITDLDKNEWYAPYMYTMRDYLMPNKESYNEFSISVYNPNENASRIDVTISLVKLLEYDMDNIDLSVLSDFKDIDSTTLENKKYIAAAVKNKLITGFTDDTFRGQDSLTRAQAASLIYRIASNEENYKGKLKENILPTGKGTYYFSANYIYEGDLVNGVPNGYGTCSKDFGEKRYEGSWVNGAPNGHGVCYGSQYTDWNDGVGTFATLCWFPDVVANGRYEGNLVNGVPDGYGIYYNENNEKIYEGNWVNGKYNGEGIYQKLGQKYKGNFVNDKMTGYGTIVYNNGDRYEGNFYNNMRSGEGTYYFNNGFRYEGNFVNGECSGYGILYNDNGKIEYAGNWASSKKNGYGRKYYTNGEGIVYDDNGAIYYDGYWQDDKMHGYGVKYPPHYGYGNEKGVWTNGLLTTAD